MPIKTRYAPGHPSFVVLRARAGGPGSGRHAENEEPDTSKEDSMETTHGYKVAFHERRAKEEHDSGNHDDAKEHEDTAKNSRNALKNKVETGNEDEAEKAKRDLNRLKK